MNIKKNSLQIRFVLTCSFLLAVLFLSACTSMVGETENEPAPLATETIQAEEVSASGEVVPARWANLFFSNGGTNLNYLISEGDQVAVSQALATVDDAAQRTALLQAQALLAKAELALEQLENLPSAEALAAAEAALASAEVNYDRLDRSGARDNELEAAQAQIDSAQAALDALKKGASDKQIDAAEQDLKAAQDGVKQAQTALDHTTLRAPFSGQVIEISLNEFEPVLPSQPVLVLADTATLLVETTDLSEGDVTRIEVGDTARLVFDALPNQTFSGKVEDIALKSSASSAVYYKVTIRVDEIPAGLRWGMSAFVVIP